MTFQQRGMLTKRIRDKAAELMMPDFTQQELRLLPYLHYLAVNQQCVLPDRVSGEERKIISRWRKEGLITGGASSEITFTRDFWMDTNELVWLGYVDLHEEVDDVHG